MLSLFPGNRPDQGESKRKQGGEVRLGRFDGVRGGGFEGSSDFPGSLLESEVRDAGVSPEDTGARGDTSPACGCTWDPSAASGVRRAAGASLTKAPMLFLLDWT